MVPYARIGLTLVPYHGTVLPLNYKGKLVRTVGVRPTTFRLKVENSIAELRAYVVLQVGIEPTTQCLRGNCSYR
jgi:hypothetical protein